MHIHRFKINELEQKAKPGVIHHLRRFWHGYRGDGTDGRDLFEAHIETIVRTPRLHFSARFHVGTAGSETPFDGHLIILGSGLYWGVGSRWLRNLADRITRERRHKYEGRDISVTLDGDGIAYLRWQLWTHPDSSERGEFARWRAKSVHVNPLDILFGTRQYWYENGEWALIAITMPEGVYPVRATIQKQLYGRPKLKRRIESTLLHVDAPKGIPTHYDPSGGWKGDRTHGFGVKFVRRYPERADWVVDAENAITGWVYSHRAQYGFRQAQEVEAG